MFQTNTLDQLPLKFLQHFVLISGTIPSIISFQTKTIFFFKIIFPHLLQFVICLPLHVVYQVLKAHTNSINFWEQILSLNLIVFTFWSLDVFDTPWKLKMKKHWDGEQNKHKWMRMIFRIFNHLFIFPGELLKILRTKIDKVRW